MKFSICPTNSVQECQSIKLNVYTDKQNLLCNLHKLLVVFHHTAWQFLSQVKFSRGFTVYLFNIGDGKYKDKSENNTDVNPRKVNIYLVSLFYQLTYKWHFSTFLLHVNGMSKKIDYLAHKWLVKENMDLAQTSCWNSYH